MNKIYLLIVVALNSYFLSAQKLDLVVTTTGDSIACSIDSTSNDEIYFTCWLDHQKISTHLEKSKVSTYSSHTIDKKNIRWIQGTIYFKLKTKTIKPNAVSFNIMGVTPIIGVTYDRVLSDHLIFEVGVGIPSIGVGIRIFPSVLSEQKTLFHYGLTINYLNSGDNEITGAEGVFFYIPVGLSYFGKTGFNFGLDFGPMFFKQEYSTDLLPYGSIKFGKRF